MWVDVAVTVFAVTFLLSMWLYMHHLYIRIHHHHLKWWAIPFAHGAVMFAKRLQDWERK